MKGNQIKMFTNMCIHTP